MRLDSWPSTPFPLNKLCEISMKVCCLICYGRRDLQEAWDAGEDNEKWAVFKDRYTDRISQLNIVVSVHVLVSLVLLWSDNITLAREP